jgi:DNA-binding response OmpR family regulator
MDSNSPDTKSAEDPARDAIHRVGPSIDFTNLRTKRVRQAVILVVDDEVLIRNLVTLLMQQDGYFVMAAADGAEALELSREYPGSIDLVITDLNMPRLDGSGLSARLLEERPGIRVLVMSGAEVGDIVGQNAHLPFLPKPFDGQTLKSRVRAILAAPALAAHPHPAI